MDRFLDEEFRVLCLFDDDDDVCVLDVVLVVLVENEEKRESEETGVVASELSVILEEGIVLQSVLDGVVETLFSVCVFTDL